MVIEDIFKLGQTSYDNLRINIMDQISRYEYTNRKKYDFLPAWQYRTLNRIGENVDEREARFRYGFDKENKIIFIDQKLETDIDFIEIYIEYFDNHILLYKYFHYGSLEIGLELDAVTKINYKDNMPHYTERFQHYEKMNEFYEYDDLHNLEKIHLPMEYDFETYDNCMEFFYEDGELLKILDKNSWASKGIIYKNLNDDEINGLFVKIEDLLFDTIINSINNYLIEKSDKLFLIYLEAHFDAHTIFNDLYVNIGLETEMLQHLEDFGEESIYDPLLYSNKELSITTPEIMEYCSLLSQYMSRNKDWIHECKHILNDLLKRINSYKWKKELLTKDFKVIELGFYD